MMTLERPEEDALEAALDNAYTALSAADPLYKLRQMAWERLRQVKLPSRKDEVFRYLRMSSFFAKDFVLGEQLVLASPSVEELASYILPECRRSYLVFVQGCFRPELSCWEGLPGKVVVSSLADAVRNFSTLVNNYWQSAIKSECDAFYLANAALHQGAAFVYIPPKTVLQAPLQILDYSVADGSVADGSVAGDAALLTMPRVHLFFGAQAEASVVMTQHHTGGAGSVASVAHCKSVAVEMALDDGATVRYTQTASALGDELWLFEAVRATLKRDSTLITVAVTDGSAAVRRDYRVALTGEGADAQLNGIWMVGGKREAHTHIFIDHQAPNCHSIQLFKGVLYGSSRSSFEGKIVVRQAAQKTDAFQRNNNLVLSPNAQAFAKPNLEIFADDVKASHGATVGQVDGEQLLYLRTRGLSEAQAKSLLVYGFCEQVLQAIPVASLRQAFEEQLRIDTVEKNKA